MRDNDTITRKVRADGNKLCPEKNGGYIPSSLGSRSISVGRQAGSEMKIFANLTTSIQRILKLNLAV